MRARRVSSGNQDRNGRSRFRQAAIHWLNAADAVAATVRLYDRLFTEANPDAASDYRTLLNPESKRVCRGYVEPSVAQSAPDTHFQFERTGYFVTDRVDHTAESPVVNLAVGLRDSWGKKA